jgi:hypothetical protein
MSKTVKAFHTYKDQSESAKEFKRNAHQKFRKAERNAIRKGDFDNMVTSLNDVSDVWVSPKDSFRLDYV